MADVSKAMINLIKCALTGAAYEHKTSDDELAEIFEKSYEHDLAHLVGYALKNSGLLDGSEMEPVYTNYIMAAVYRYEKINYELTILCDALEKAEIPFIPLKGAVIRKYYPEPWMRTSCDIDVLVHKEDVDTAIGVLCAIGYERQAGTTKYDHTLNTPSGVHVEMHYHLNTNGILAGADALLSDIWSYIIQSNGYEKNMTNEMFILYHVAHMAKHFVRGGCGIRPITDLWIIRHRMTFDEEQLNKMLKKAALMQFYEQALNLCDVWFEQKTHTTLTEQMEEFVLTGGIYGSFGNYVAIKATQGVSSVTVFLKMAFLSYSKLAYVYPRLKKCPYLYLFYQVKRWFRIFNKVKRQKVINITEAHVNVSEEVADKTGKMLKNLGF